MALTLVSAKRPFAALPERKFTCIALVMQTTAWLARVLAVCAGARGSAGGARRPSAAASDPHISSLWRDALIPQAHHPPDSRLSAYLTLARADVYQALSIHSL